MSQIDLLLESLKEKDVRVWEIASQTVAYYTALSVRRLKESIREIMCLFTQRGFEIYGVGFPWYFDRDEQVVEILAIIASTLSAFLSNELSPDQLLAKLPPDLDFLVVPPPEDPEKPLIWHPNLPVLMKEDFFRQYKHVIEEVYLKLQYKHLDGPLSQIAPLRFPPDLALDTKQISVELIPISRNVWDKIVYFVTEEDTQEYGGLSSLLGDLLLTSEDSAGGLSPHVKNYRVNFLLYTLGSLGRSRQAHYIDQSCLTSQILERHPKKWLMEHLPSVRSRQLHFWEQLIAEVIRMDLLAKQSDGWLHLTSEGECQLGEILERRTTAMLREFLART